MTAAVLLALLGYGLFVSAPLSKPLMTDEVYFALDAAQPHYGLIGLWHPPLYFDTLRLLHHLGFHDHNLRLVGILGVALSLWLTAMLCRRIAEEEQVANVTPWCWLFLLTHPWLIQGSMVVDIDTTLLPPVMLGFVWLFASGQRAATWLRRWAWAGAFWLCLWMKWPPSVILLASAVGWLLLQRRWRQTVLAVGVGVTVGVLFLGAWWLYAETFHLSRGALVERMAIALTHGSYRAWLPSGADLLNRVIRIGLWIGPLHLVLFGVGVWLRVASRKVRQGLGTLDLCWITAVMILVVYSVLGAGTTFGFAKYQFPWLMFAGVCLGATAATLPGRAPRPHLVAALLMAVAIAANNLDALYLWNHEVRLATIFEPHRVRADVGLVAALLGVWGLFVAGLTWLGCRRHSLSLALWSAATAGALAWNLSLDWMQWRAPYATGLGYGRGIQEMREVAAQLKQLAAKHPGIAIVAPDDVLHLAGLPIGRTRGRWSEERTGFVATVSDPAVSVVVTTPEWHMVRFYREVLHDPGVRGLLHQAFEPVSFGLTTVWLRRGLSW